MQVIEAFCAATLADCPWQTPERPLLHQVSEGWVPKAGLKMSRRVCRYRNTYPVVDGHELEAPCALDFSQAGVVLQDGRDQVLPGVLPAAVGRSVGGKAWVRARCVEELMVKAVVMKWVQIIPVHAGEPTSCYPRYGQGLSQMHWR
jgi:hypothetical protein